jgi:protein-tyrosine phosphatase
MIDMHCHILPGMDDGPGSIEEAVEMARIAVGDGITDIIATPHTHDGVYMQEPERVAAAAEALQLELERRGIPLRIHPGMEVHFHLDMLKHLDKGELLTLAGGTEYLLLELPFQQIPSYATDFIHSLLHAGITPIIAHPERNAILLEKREVLAEWIEMGALAQLTAESLTGRFGKRLKVAAKEMVRQRLVQLIASDAHDPIRRRPFLSEAYHLIAKIDSPEAADLFRANAEAVLRGAACQVPEPDPGRKKRFLFFY